MGYRQKSEFFSRLIQNGYVKIKTRYAIVGRSNESFFYYFNCFFVLFFLFVNDSSRIDSGRFCSKYSTRTNIRTLFNSGGVLEDVLGLEATFWSPWRWPERSSPWPRSLQVLENALSSAEDSTIFWIVKMGHGHDFFTSSWRTPENLWRPFFFDNVWNFAEIFLFLTRLLLFWKTLARCSTRSQGGRGPPPPQFPIENATSENNGTKKPCFFSVF